MTVIEAVSTDRSNKPFRNAFCKAIAVP